MRIVKQSPAAGFLTIHYSLPRRLSPHEGVPFVGLTELTLLWSIIAAWIYNNTGSILLVWFLHLKREDHFHLVSEAGAPVR
jgi:hypothetical protein